MALNIDTTKLAYQAQLSGFDTLQYHMIPKLKMFAKLPEEKQRWWLQRDPLLRKIIRFAVATNKFVILNTWMGEIDD